MELPYAEPYKIKTVETIQQSTVNERELWIKQANYNLFNLKSQQVFIDLLTDSGTGAMSDKQWAAIMTGDESYAGSVSYYELQKTITDIFGFKYFLPTHQGRAAENVLFSALLKPGQIVPGNSQFDTTKGHIEHRKATAIDCTVDCAFETTNNQPFKGNIDIDKLKNVINNNPISNIPFILITITNNNVGGQPVSLQNIKDVWQLAQQHNIPLVFDSARFAENAYFIKKREPGYASKTIQQIITEMYQYADYATMSCKKDGIVNIGGFIGFNNKTTYNTAITYNIMYEGFITYGGMAGRDMAALAQGLREATTFEYLESRVKQVEYLGNKLTGYGIPIQNPVGGHAVFVDAGLMLPKVPSEQFIAQTLGIELYIESGVRAVEIGALLADRDPITRQNRYPKTEFLRLAIPRRTYTNNHMDYVAAALKNIFDRRTNINSGYKIIDEAPIMRHFTVKLDKV